MSNFGLELGAGTPNGLRYVFGTVTFRNDLEMFSTIKNISDAVFAPLFKNSTVPGLRLSVVLQPLTSSMLAKGCGKNSLGLCPSDGNLVILDLTVQWSLSQNSDAVNAASEALISQVTAAAEGRGLLHPYIYLNYALQSQDPISAYGNKSVANMRAMSKKFDPAQVFQKLVPGGFKL